MTEKKEQILKAALLLFAEQGYQNTSTSKIAKRAKVSEALIYRHFKHKEGLLEAITKDGEEKLAVLLSEILTEENPKQLIRKTLEMPFNVKEKDFDFWKLQFKLKWELDQYNVDKVKPLENALTKAFKQLNYKNPQLEAAFIIHFIDGISGAILRNAFNDQLKMKKFLINKYNLQ